MTTARDFIRRALKTAGVLGVGQTGLAEDYTDGLTSLNDMLSQWQRKRWLVPSLYEIAALGNNQKSNLIGPGQYYNAQRPDKIQAAYFKQLVGGDPSNLVSFPLTPLWSYENYATLSLKDLNSWPQFFFYDNAFPYGNVYIWPIPSNTYEIHLILKSPIGFTIELASGDIFVPGAGYVDGNYIAVPLTNLTGFGNGGTLDITVAGGKITAAAIHDPGDGYKINDMLTANNTFLGGTGAGFIYRVDSVTDDLDAIFNMPEEYNDAIHYNLSKRLCLDYQYAVDVDLRAEAKKTLLTLRKANTQIPILQMPAELRNVRSNNFYIFNADVR